jgi:uncharacterized membrane protein
MVRDKAKRTGGEARRSGARRDEGPRLAGALACIVLGTALCAATSQSVLGSKIASGSIASHGLMDQLDARLVGEPASPDSTAEPPLPPFGPIFLALAVVSLGTWLAGAWWIARRSRIRFATSAANWGLRGWMWWIFGGGWEIVRLLALMIGSDGSQVLVLSSASIWIAVATAGWAATFLTLTQSASGAESAGNLWSPVGDPLAKPNLRVAPSGGGYGIPPAVWICFVTYVVVFVAMNWQLYRGLKLPHGDSAMYEEHLWNVLHGNGFRSYLDQGLFLGEHVQVIHLLFLPFYLLWPSQMLLELGDSLLLAASCFPVYWITYRHTGLRRAAAWLAAASLLYFPLQYLDIAIDFKTFRPNGLGIPILLFALDQLERRRHLTFCLLVTVALSAQEDYAIVLAPLGLWIAFSAWRGGRSAPRLAVEGETGLAGGLASNGAELAQPNLRTFAFGAGLALCSVIYLIVATRVVMAHFRHGAEIHYASYFKKFGTTLPEIAKTMATHPALLWEAFINAHSAEYALLLLAPLGFLPLLSPGRLAVALPLFLTLCLNEVIDSPLHHVHAAAVPILLWSAAAGLGAVSRLRFRTRGQIDSATSGVAADSASSRTLWWARFACLSAIVTGVFYGLGPLSIGFWDPYSGFFWRDHYVPGARASAFAHVVEEIPQTARVASTDFVHPRFTHFARSYDYSDYPRAVNNYQRGVPPDTDYIVIDTHGPYSKIERPDQVREYREHPDQWELLPDTTDGYFIVLKRRQAPAVE